LKLISWVSFNSRFRPEGRRERAQFACGEFGTSRRFGPDNAGVPQIAIGKAQIVEKAQELGSASSALRLGKRQARDEGEAQKRGIYTCANHPPLLPFSLPFSSPWLCLCVLVSVSAS
jgi:hypothetical protein